MGSPPSTSPICSSVSIAPTQHAIVLTEGQGSDCPSRKRSSKHTVDRSPPRVTEPGKAPPSLSRCQYIVRKGGTSTAGELSMRDIRRDIRGNGNAPGTPTHTAATGTPGQELVRSDERHVGRESDSTCRYRWSRAT